MTSLGLSPEELWVVVTACLCAATCAIPGTFLMFKRASLLGDAISHSILPGLALAFLISGSREPLPMMLGALAAGVLATSLSSLLVSRFHLKSDAALGIVFTSFFALGVVLITVVARNIDLDPGCILYGLIELTPFDTIDVWGWSIPRATIGLALAFVLNVTLTSLFFKEITLALFDPGLATSCGFHPTRIHYALVSITTITAIVAFEAVGSILVIAMLIVPGATAYLLSDRLSTVVILAAILGGLSGILGFWGALSLNTSVAGMMSVAAGALFTIALLCSPTHGILARITRRADLRVRIAKDDVLGILYRWHEVSQHQAAEPLTAGDVVNAVGRNSLTRFALWSLQRRGNIITARDGALRLSERGLIEGQAVVRSHRLWESYLAKHLGLPLDHLHAPSERAEHFIGRALAREIEEDVGSSRDPHGRSIP